MCVCVCLSKGQLNAIKMVGAGGLDVNVQHLEKEPALVTDLNAKPSPCQLAAVRFNKKLIGQSIYVSGALFRWFGMPRNNKVYNRSDIHVWTEHLTCSKTNGTVFILIIYNPQWPPQICRLQHIHIHNPLAFLMNYAIMLSANCVRQRLFQHTFGTHP